MGCQTSRQSIAELQQKNRSTNVYDSKKQVSIVTPNNDRSKWFTNAQTNQITNQGNSNIAHLGIDSYISVKDQSGDRHRVTRKDVLNDINVNQQLFHEIKIEHQNYDKIKPKANYKPKKL